MNDALRRAAKALFAGDSPVEFVLGYRRNPALPGRAVPFYARSADDCDRLVFDHTCQINLSGLVKLHHRRTKRFAVVAKGCDARGLVSLVQEKQLRREQVVVLAVPCRGVVDFGRLSSHRDAPAFDEALVEERCRACDLATPRFFDVLVEVTAREAPAESLPPSARALAEQPLDERWAAWQVDLSRCIRCHACRKICPVCACASCIFDSTTPTWVDRSSNPSDNTLYSMVRLWHLSGRCVGCGECERACPAGIPFTRITAHLAADSAALFGLRPGDDPTAKRILSTFDEQQDAELADFIR